MCGFFFFFLWRYTLDERFNLQQAAGSVARAPNKSKHGHAEGLAAFNLKGRLTNPRKSSSDRSHEVSMQDLRDH